MLYFTAQRLRALEEDNRNLTMTMQFFVEEFNNIRSSHGTVSNCVRANFGLLIDTRTI